MKMAIGRCILGKSWRLEVALRMVGFKGLEQVLLRFRKFVSISHSLNFSMKVQRWTLKLRRRNKDGIEVCFWGFPPDVTFAARFLIKEITEQKVIEENDGTYDNE